ncbi:MAG: GNAT family N-acetyltransferase [Anaerolineae bacterium]
MKTKMVTEVKKLTGDFVLRPPTMDDVPGAVAVVNACSMELIGRPETEEHEYRNDWQSPTISMENDLRVIEAPNGEIVGYASVWDVEPHVRIFGRAHVHPAYKDHGLETALDAWLEARAEQALSKAPEGTRVSLLQGAQSVDEDKQAFLERRGYTLVRHWFRMLIEMDGPPPAPQFPEAIRVRTFDREADLRRLILADREIFRDHWGYVEHPLEEQLKDWEHWLDHDPDHDPTLWFLAVDGDEIVGFSLCAPKTAEDPEMGYVMMLGVRRPWRRQGIALGLLHHTFGAFYRRGTRKVSLDVDASSLTGATRLYEKAGMHVRRQSISYEKVLREGEDLSTQTVET